VRVASFHQGFDMFLIISPRGCLPTNLSESLHNPKNVNNIIALESFQIIKNSIHAFILYLFYFGLADP
jgi:hypothetical protein